MTDSNLLAALVDATAVEEAVYFNDDKIEHGQAILDNLHATGYTVVRTDDVKRTKRQAHLAYLYLNVADCPRCHLPKNSGYICPCGYDL